MNKFTNFPKKFTVGGLTFEIEMGRLFKQDDEEVYGYLSMPKQKIFIATHMIGDNEGDPDIELSADMVWNTLYHELIHVFQYLFENEFDEAQAQSYANFLCEYFKTLEY